MPNRRTVLEGGAGLLTGVGLAGCAAVVSETEADASREPGSAWSAPTDPPAPDAVAPTVLVENLEIPWDLAVAPTGEFFVTERTGRIRSFDGGRVTAVVEPDDVVDASAVEPGTRERSWWVEGGEGGLLGVAVHPSYPAQPLVYAYYTYGTADGRYNKVVAFGVPPDGPAIRATTVVDRIPADSHHNGGRIAFGPDGSLWITTGDAGDGASAQDPASLAGKVLRVTPTGDPAPGNPDLPGGDPRVFTYGHRNPQGLAWLPDGTPVVTEHGPGGHDEVNVLVPGGNYGWPDARDADGYEGTDYRRPVANTGGETWAPSGCTFYTGDAVPGWRNRLVVGTLAGQRVAVVTLSPPGRSPPPADGDAVRFDADWLDDRFVATAHPALADALGRVRHVAQGPGGALYALTSNRDGRARGPFPTARDDVLVRLDPA